MTRPRFAARVETGEVSPASPRTSLRPLAYVQPGQMFVSSEPAEATTVLGSCVAVCLWDARLRAGGMNHFLLPGPGRDRSARFGDTAVDALVEQMQRLGCRTADLTAKMFGGAAVIEVFRHGDDHLGARNVETARSRLAHHRVPIVAEDVLGSRGRKLVFETASGVVLVRLL